MNNGINKEAVEKWLSNDENLLQLDYSSYNELGLYNRITIIKAMLYNDLSGGNKEERIEKLDRLKVEMVKYFYLSTDDGTMNERYKSITPLLPEILEIIFGERYDVRHDHRRLIMSSIFPLSNSKIGCSNHQETVINYYEAEAYMPNKIIEHIKNDVGFKSGWEG